jgi:hypothetical protein
LNKKLLKIVNSQNILSNALVEYQEDMSKISENKRCAEMNIQSLTKQVNELQEQLDQINRQTETIQQKISNHSSNHNHEEEFLKLKAVIDQVETEIKKIKIRCGVLSNYIINKELINKKLSL